MELMSTPLSLQGFGRSEIQAVALERRAKPRIKERFPARVWGVNVAGHPFDVDCVLDNLSATGLYLRMPIEMGVGCEINLAVRLSNHPQNGAVAGLSGLVLRNEPQPDCTYGIAVTVRHHEFLV